MNLNDTSSPDSVFSMGFLPCGQILIPNIPKEHQYIASASLLLQIGMLAITFLVGHQLKRMRIYIVQEAGAALIFGILVGLMVKFLGHQDEFKKWVNFNNNFFFYFLLPPIIFESGWSLQTKTFFRNFGAVCAFAFGGTIISTFFIATFMYLIGMFHLAFKMPFLICLIFGSLISATDPVTVLAIFNELGVDLNLFSYVFGESVLNDAIAIVLYRTVLSFIDSPISNRGIGAAFGFFIIIFVGSFTIGVMIGLLSAVLFKYGGLKDDSLSMLQSCLLVLFPYIAYMMADALMLSGIVAILFTGITMKYYTAPNLSENALEIATNFFEMLAKLSETFVFIYMGVAVFLEDQSWKNYQFALFAIIGIFLARIFNVYPMAYIVNLFRKSENKILFAHQHALWFSGLRGAMAFALALESVKDLPNGYGRVILTTTLFIIAFTVLFVGGFTSPMLNYLEIDCNVSKIDCDEVEEVGNQNEESLEIEEEKMVLGSKHLTKQKAKLKKKLRKLKKEASFASIDQKYLTPFFSSKKASRKHHKSKEGISSSRKSMDDVEHGVRRELEMEYQNRGAFHADGSSDTLLLLDKASAIE